MIARAHCCNNECIYSVTMYDLLMTQLLYCNIYSIVDLTSLPVSLFTYAPVTWGDIAN